MKYFLFLCVVVAGLLFLFSACKRMDDAARWRDMGYPVGQGNTTFETRNTLKEEAWN